MTIRGASATPQSLHDCGDVCWAHVRSVLMVDRDDRRPAAAAEAFDGPQRHLVVTGRPTCGYAQLVLEALEDLLRADERTGDVRADLDEMPAGGLAAEHVVEGRDGLTERRRRSQRVSRLAQCVRGEVPVLLLGELERRQRRRAP